MIMSKRSIFKLFLVIFLFYFVLLFYITKSKVWAGILATVATSPVVILWWFFSWLKRMRQVQYREPYIIGNSTEIEYLAPEELERRLRNGKGDKNHEL
ncbi:hypothetical protein [Thermococcus thioreducens]|uniref:Uncharacterized protein n=1 Tax=Thermococcus thioreducens TaxID=277988 RepID=A0A0Q2S5H3_9EURY|nr:hypothetical protein [Thermococcus thioreducens]ASJ12109.1 hypothetical protein A3L14_04090 [Thermococcus thioreducens]KQH82675.1 hypothetical protein AMR53_03475 [Thermococcus thioreducens]SEW08189.1 hypothetical protein SAMN05216170_1452 [Thermococcus thioreducens]